MKFFKFFVVVLYLLSFQNNPAKAQEVKTLVGTLEKEQPVITIDKAKMLEVYNAYLLKYTSIDAKFTQVEILKNTSEGQPEEPYFLVFKGKVYASSFVVIEEGSNLYALASISCVTEDCSSEDFGCTPKRSQTSCFPCNNKGKCTKTVSEYSMIEELKLKDVNF
jgi:hypothetical protein